MVFSLFQKHVYIYMFSILKIREKKVSFDIKKIHYFLLFFLLCKKFSNK